MNTNPNQAPEAYQKTSQYYQSVYRRTSVITAAFMHMIQSLLSWPCLLVEVFIRSKMGRRHFSMTSAVLVFILLLVIPVFITRVQAMGFYSSGYGNVLSKNITWYLFALAFLGFSFYRQKEIGAKGSEFDFGHFSLSHGLSLPVFYKLEGFGFKVNPRRIAIIYEPALFFIVGLLLAIIGQAVGLLLIFAGLCYAWHNALAYKKGDDFILDKIDEVICKEEVAASFLEQKSAEQTRGFEFYGFRPENPDLRRKVVDTFTDDIPLEAF